MPDLPDALGLPSTGAVDGSAVNKRRDEFLITAR
jgi:hypothetical protein